MSGEPMNLLDSEKFTKKLPIKKTPKKVIKITLNIAAWLTKPNGFYFSKVLLK